MLRFLDIFFTILHLLIIGFNLLGWIWRRTRGWHLVSVMVTAGSWMVLGIWFGMGYCPLTDWHWDVKRKLGETDLPVSFITYFAELLTGLEFDDGFVNMVTAVVFILVAALSLWLNLRDRLRKGRRGIS